MFKIRAFAGTSTHEVKKLPIDFMEKALQMHGLGPYRCFLLR
ncbi:hypothetical protein C4K00_4505 [Pseudomonas synxantha]|nr:hypothetical protein C4K00_4505 [Pseudomonas synxantha]AZE80306.1 hypothetical protein C4J99_4549 [Pseudomonas synxantha]